MMAYLVISIVGVVSAAIGLYVGLNFAQVADLVAYYVD